MQAIDELPDNIARVDAFLWLARWVDASSVQAALVRLLEREDDATSLAEMIDGLESLAAIPPTLAQPIWDALRPRFEARSEHSWMRCHALRGGLLVVQNSPSLIRRLQAYILDVDAQDDGAYLRHVAKVAGVILRRYPDDDFRAVLHTLAGVEASADEAALELGLDQLRQSLVAQTQTGVSLALASAREWFERSLTSSENRPDARLYEICASVLIATQATGLDGALDRRLPELRRWAFEFSAYAAASHCATSWLSGIPQERFHWLSMASKLATLGRSFTKDIWLHANLVIEEELLAIFFVGERIFGRSDASGMNLLARNAIVTALRRRSFYVEAIDQWLVENGDSTLAPSVRQVRDAVRQTVVDGIHRHPFDEAAEVRIADLLRKSGVDAATAAMTAAQIEVAVDRNQPVAPVWQRMMDDLSECADIDRCPAKALLETMCTLMLRFLEFRASVGTATDPSSEYVFRRGSNLPVEHDLHLDFLKFLSSTDTPSIQAEARDTGGGRSDIAIAFRGLKTIVEVKKDDNVPDNKTLAQRYAGQATGYLTTGVRFGFLLVLDLTDRAGHQPHISEQISVERKKPTGSDVEYHVITARIQGKRKTPHQLR
ncbi:hypothetical protein [Sphingomonas solaris]|uniref:hypothetical protein n=1 Tax=Alterirhizorhabdus solaris TaxID=2529389 RepID=UPI00193A2957|nr:hypothetical protein [Sphingomonas solaris]